MNKELQEVLERAWVEMQVSEPDARLDNLTARLLPLLEAGQAVSDEAKKGHYLTDERLAVRIDAYEVALRKALGGS